MNTLDPIAAQLQGYDPNALRADTALQFLQRLVQPITESCEVALMQALGRVVAHDVISPVHVPAHDNSAMDGYALDGALLPVPPPPSPAQALHAAADPMEPLELTVVGTALAGSAWQGPVHGLQCVKIMTGAIMPAGLDTVVPQELVHRLGERITIAAGTVRPGDNRRHKGEDIALGQAALTQGTLITPAALGLLASLGLPQVTVLRRLRVAFFSTGDEILNLGEAPREGAVYDSNRFTLFGLLSRMGVEVLDLGAVRDEPAALEAAFRSAAAQADAVITSGGVSVGDADHTKTMMKKLGDVAFWKIAMRPGRPMAVGQIFNEKYASSPQDTCVRSYENNSIEVATKPIPPRSTILFGLPGNPVAVMVTFLAFVRPALLQMMGCNAPALPLLQARTAEPVRKKPGRTEYQRVVVSPLADGTLSARSTGQQGSGVLSSMVQANGLMVLGHDQGNLATGDTVQVLMFDGAI